MSVDMSDSQPSNFEHRAHVGALDGLRAIAIVMVLLWHLTPGHNSDRGLRSLVFKLSDVGWSGVDLFFVLSGFLITRILLRAKNESRPIWFFVVRRLLRIVPAYYVALTIVFFIFPFFGQAYPMPAWSQQLPNWLYVSNMFPESQGTVGGRFAVSHFWSLAVEMQFYLLWPLVVYHCKARSIAQAGWLCLVFALAARAIAVVSGADWRVTYCWMPLHMDGLIIGSMIAVALHSGITWVQARPIVLALILALGTGIFGLAWVGRATSVIKTNDVTFDMWMRVLLPLAVSTFYGAILWFSLQRNWLASFLAHPAFGPIARYSYGIYIIHYLLMPTFEAAFGPEVLRSFVSGSDLPIYTYLLLSSCISFMIAMVSYHFVEVRFLKLGSRY